MNRKTIFDEVRRILGRGFRPAEVMSLDEAINRAERGNEVSTLASGAIGAAGIALLKNFEGCAKRRSDGLIEAYPDPATGGAPWTIGWGSTGADITPDTVWTRQQCDARLERDLRRFCADVSNALGNAPTTQNQFDAMVSFHYNTGATRRATLTRLHKAGDHAGAAREFARWNKAAGRVLPGLVRRRAAEAQLYCQP